jgi:hypothetical protein
MLTLANRLMGRKVSVPWTLENPRYVGTFDPTRKIAMSMFFKPDGTKFWLVNNDTTNVLDNVYEYTLTTAWDIRTASETATFNLGGIVTPAGLWINSTGTKMIVLSQSGSTFYSWNLSTAWDITTANTVDATATGTGDTTAFGIQMSPDESKLFIVGNQTDTVRAFSITSFDVDNIAFVASASVASVGTVPRGLSMSPDGLKLFVSDNGLDGVSQFSLGAAWDVTTLSYDNVFLDTSDAGETGPYGVCIGNDGASLYVTGFQNGVTQYDL